MHVSETRFRPSLEGAYTRFKLDVEGAPVENVPKDVLAELSTLLNRLKTLTDKVKNPSFQGSYRFED